MNIFWLDKNLHTSATLACDQHIVKMCLEYAQILCTVLHDLGLEDDRLYKPTHRNHPCVRWVRESSRHFDLVFGMLYFYGMEYTRRFHKTHKSAELMETIIREKIPTIQNRIDLYEGTLIDTERTSNISYGLYTPTRMPPLCMPEQYQLGNDTWENLVNSYRRYYLAEKMPFARYTSIAVPTLLPVARDTYSSVYYRDGSTVTLLHQQTDPT